MLALDPSSMISFKIWIRMADQQYTKRVVPHSRIGFDPIQSAISNIMARLLVDVQPFKATLTIFHACNCFLFASSVSAFALPQMLWRVVADAHTMSLHKALYSISNGLQWTTSGMSWDRESTPFGVRPVEITAPLCLGGVGTGTGHNAAGYSWPDHIAEHHFCEMRSLASINYLSCDRVTIWYIRNRRSNRCSVTSHLPGCGPITIGWVAVKCCPKFIIFGRDCTNKD